MERKINKNISNKGITLVALVVTIIVLLILAGVILNLSIGNNGIFSRANKAAEEYKIQMAKEKIELAVGEYEEAMRRETIYSMLNKVEGLESIEPNDEMVGLPYTVIVDGYEFIVKEGIEVIYQGKANGIIPQITKCEEEIAGDIVKLKIEASTKDREGIQEIRLIKDGIEINKKTVNGKKIVEEFDITSNGNYRVKVIGVNKKQSTSEEIVIIQLSALSGTIRSGEVIDGGVLLTINAKSETGTIEKLEIYNDTNKLGEILDVESGIEEEYEIDYMPFGEEWKCYAKIIEGGKSVDTNIVELVNKNSIKTSADLIKFTELVNSGEDFSQKIIKQIAEINLNNNITSSIGTSEYPFKGIYDGGNNKIVNLNINSSNTMQGLFGYIEDATIENIILGTGVVTGANRVGGAVGYAYDSKLVNITNEGVVVKATGVYTETFNVYNQFENIQTHTVTNCVSLGGICGKAENTDISNCVNKKEISISTTGAVQAVIGGIVGYSCGTGVKIIENCTNSAKISKGSYMGGVVGLINGSIIINKCANRSVIEGISIVAGGIVGLANGVEILQNGKIIANINECENGANVTGTLYVGGIIGCDWGPSASNKYYLINKCINTGKIVTTGYETFGYFSNGTSVKGEYQTCSGGISGWSSKTKIFESYNTADVQANITKAAHGVGGISGFIANSQIIQCFNTGNIGASANKGAGGIVGCGFKKSTINSCYNKGTLTGNIGVGGIVGWIEEGNIRNCYNTAFINGLDQVAGIAAWLGNYDKDSYTNNYLYNCYNRGPIVSSGNAGSISAYTTYYDVDYVYSLTGTSSSAWGTWKSNKNGYNTGFLDDATLKSTVVAWEGFEEDKNNINSGYPVLSWQVAE